MGSKLTFPICWKAGYKGVKGCKSREYNKGGKKSSRSCHLWLLPFSKDSSSSSLFSRSLLFMNGNFLLKLIFCFALGPRLRVPVDLDKIKSLLSLWLKELPMPMDLTTNQLEFSAWELRRLDTACSNENPLSSPKVAFWSCECTREADIASGPHGDTVRVHDVTWKRNCQADVKTRHA